MIDLFHSILDKLNLGIVLVNSQRKVVLWNQWMTSKTNKKAYELVGHPLTEACPRFGLPAYDNIIQSAFETGQSRFISGAVHGAFFKQAESDYLCEQPGDTSHTKIRQNLQVEVINLNSERYVLIQVYDVTSQYQKVKKMRSFIKVLESENDEIRQTEVISRQMALTDPLTGLANRLHFTNYLEKNLSASGLNHHMAALFFLDLDGFKQVNDQYGHAIGDKVLQETAFRLKNVVRTTDLVARLGGDEFTIVLTSIHTLKDVVHVANKILGEFAEPFKIGDVVTNLTCSFGISVIPQDGTDPHDLMEKADMALYRVKKSGKYGFSLYSERGKIYKCSW